MPKPDGKTIPENEAPDRRHHQQHRGFRQILLSIQGLYLENGEVRNRRSTATGSFSSGLKNHFVRAEIHFSINSTLLSYEMKYDGFVISPEAALRYILRRCGVPAYPKYAAPWGDEKIAQITAAT